MADSRQPQGTRGGAQLLAAQAHEVRGIGQAAAKADLGHRKTVEARVAEHAPRGLHAAVEQRGGEGSATVGQAAVQAALRDAEPGLTAEAVARSRPRA